MKQQEKITSVVVRGIVTLNGGKIIPYCLEPTGSDAWFIMDAEVMIMTARRIVETELILIYNGQIFREVWEDRPPSHGGTDNGGFKVATVQRIHRSIPNIKEKRRLDKAVQEYLPTYLDKSEEPEESPSQNNLYTISRIPPTRLRRLFND